MVPIYCFIGIYCIVSVNYYPVKDFIGEVGCHLTEWLEVYGVICFQSISFYNSLFRFMCIVLPDNMRTMGLSPMVIKL